MTVEDSTLIRTIINDIIKEIDGVELVATAENGKVALPMIKEFKPDLITLDVEMPVMDGLETLKKIREFTSIPVLMLSARTDQETTIRALEKGAQDFLPKPEYIIKNKETFKAELASHIKALTAKKTNEKQENPKRVSKKNTNNKQTNQKLKNKKIDAIAIGASTGGPKVLTDIVKMFPKDLAVPVFIVQHMPKEFTGSFAKRMNNLADVPVVEAQDRMLIKNGHVYLAPGGKHMVINKKRIQLTDDKKLHGVRPAVDPLFDSVAKYYGENVLGAILTGMGRDGAIGCQSIRKAGGYILAQDEESSVVYGMARNAVEQQAVDEIVSINNIIKIMKEIVNI